MQDIADSEHMAHSELTAHNTVFYSFGTQLMQDTADSEHTAHSEHCSFWTHSL